MFVNVINLQFLSSHLRHSAQILHTYTHTQTYPAQRPDHHLLTVVGREETPSFARSKVWLVSLIISH